MGRWMARGGKATRTVFHENDDFDSGLFIHVTVMAPVSAEHAVMRDDWGGGKCTA